MTVSTFDNFVVSQIREGASHLPEIAPPHASSDFYVFFSYDLANSTRYKTVVGSQWPMLVKEFYEMIRESYVKLQLDVRVWKHVGDEVLFYSRMREIKDVYRVVPNAYRVLTDTIERLHQQFPHARPLISVKGSVWCARVWDVPPQDWGKGTQEFAEGENLNLIIRPDSERSDVDFLGPDIDIGFRIGKFAIRKRLVVSADLCYLLWRERGNMSESLENDLRIVSYQHLDGVWDGRRYPILWYEKKWSDIGSSFDYDDHFDSPLVQEAKTVGELNIPAERRLGWLKKVYQDREQTTQIEEFCDDLRELKADNNTDVALLAPITRRSELHCVAICFRSDGRVLVGKRQPDKNVMPGKWEFGCGQLRLNETFEQCLLRAYQEDFGIRLNFNGEPRPVRTFLIQDTKRNRVIPGLIFVADVADGQEAEARRHEKVDWVDPSHIAFHASDCVPDFVYSIELARKIRSDQSSPTQLASTSDLEQPLPVASVLKA